jgi:hypothetical protein
MLNQFLSDITVLVNERELTASHIQADKDTISLWLMGIYNIWACSFRQKTGREPFDELSIRKYLTDEPYYIKTDKVQFMDGRKRAFILDINKVPEALQEAVDIMRTRKWNETG